MDLTQDNDILNQNPQNPNSGGSFQNLKVKGLLKLRWNQALKEVGGMCNLLNLWEANYNYPQILKYTIVIYHIFWTISTTYMLKWY